MGSSRQFSPDKWYANFGQRATFVPRRDRQDRKGAEAIPAGRAVKRQSHGAGSTPQRIFVSWRRENTETRAMAERHRKTGRMQERCQICGCLLHREGGYAEASVRGRSHATQHHYVAERFFGRSANRPGTKRRATFAACPWGYEGQKGLFCYECHEELLHNPVLLPDDIAKFARLVQLRGLSGTKKSVGKSLIARRIILLHEVIVRGLDSGWSASKSRRIHA